MSYSSVYTPDNKHTSDIHDLEMSRCREQPTRKDAEPALDQVTDCVDIGVRFDGPFA